MDIARKGDISSIYWKDSIPTIDKDKLDVSCKVHYVSLGIKDLMFAMGKIPGNHKYKMGTEFSGLTDKGKRVVGVVDRQVYLLIT